MFINTNKESYGNLHNSVCNFRNVERIVIINAQEIGNIKTDNIVIIPLALWDLNGNMPMHSLDGVWNCVCRKLSQIFNRV